MGVHDDCHLFPFNSLIHWGDEEVSLTWFDDEVVPEEFKATDLLHFALWSWIGQLCPSLREKDYGKVYFMF